METLVVGARPNSIGAAVAHLLNTEPFYGEHFVSTAGLTDEDFNVDIRMPMDVKSLVDHTPWDHVICTVGINEETDLIGGSVSDLMNSLDKHLFDNFVYPMLLFKAWLKTVPNEYGSHHFVFLSSNSAHVPRSKSLAYCASKAALSQAVRCAGRAVPPSVCVYAYEPGWVVGTPMSNEVMARLQLSDKGNLMRGGEPMDVMDLAKLICTNLMLGGPRVLNGMTISLDGGER